MSLEHSPAREGATSTGKDALNEHSLDAALALSVGKAAKALDVSVASIWRAINRNDLEAVKFGGRTLVTVDSIRRALSPQEAA